MTINQPYDPETQRYEINWDKFKEFMRIKEALPADKLIILTLLFRTCNKNYCFPGHRSIAYDTGFSTRYVRARLKKLEEIGLLDVTRGGLNPKTGWGYKSNTYHLNRFLYKGNKKTHDKESKD